jgi:hypothetical protein
VRRLLGTATALALLAPAPAWAQTATPVPAPTPPYDCGARLEVPASPVDAWGLDGLGGAEVTVYGSPRDPGSGVSLYGYTRPAGPGQERVLATAQTDEYSVARIRLPISGSSRLYAVAAGCVFASEHEVIVVRDRLEGLGARRLSPRRYVFSGFHAAPPGKVLSLYRVTAEGRSVLTAQTRTGGEFWQIERTFLGSGEWDFYAATGTDANSVGTTSNRRRTVVH